MTPKLAPSLCLALRLALLTSGTAWIVSCGSGSDGDASTAGPTADDAGADDTGAATTLTTDTGAASAGSTGPATWSQVQDLLTDLCMTCHSQSSPMGIQGGLDLTVDPCARLVSVPATNTFYDGALLVAPGDHQQSVLWHKLAATGTYGQA
ncbi:MAG: hypothetical protein GXP62_21495, partial [Oligoflexia bacterium]|nr:hypothetical protein [Oligoflexia bacterium]